MDVLRRVAVLNDGIGLVAFTFFFSLAMSGETIGALEALDLLRPHRFGGILLGAAYGYLGLQTHRPR